MPAPNISYLLDLESAYEDALKNYFANLNVGGSTFAQVITPRTNFNAADYLKTPRLQIRCGIGSVMQDGSGLKEDRYTWNGNLVSYWSAYSLTAEFTVCTQRYNNEQNHGLLRGAVRQALLPASAIMNNAVLPYYQTVDVLPLTSTQGIDPDNDEINSQLMYQVDVFIPPTSFPNS